MVRGAIREAILKCYAQTLPLGEQRKFALDVYDSIYDDEVGEIGESIGACRVHFDCPYSTHVSYHCEGELKRRIANIVDPCACYELHEVAPGSYDLLVVVASASDHPYMVAEACAMSAVLRIPTVVGSYDRRGAEFAGVTIDEALRLLSEGA